MKVHDEHVFTQPTSLVYGHVPGKMKVHDEHVFTQHPCMITLHHKVLNGVTGSLMRFASDHLFVLQQGVKLGLVERVLPHTILTLSIQANN
eukprot:1350390-Rhodomonas_salina.3